MLTKLFQKVSKPVLAMGFALSLMATSAFGETTGAFEYKNLTHYKGTPLSAKNVHEWVKHKCPDPKTKELTCVNKAVTVLYGGRDDLSDAFKETLRDYSPAKGQKILYIRANDNDKNVQSAILMNYVNGDTVSRIDMETKKGLLDRHFAYGGKQSENGKSTIDLLKKSTEELFEKYLPS